MAVWLSVHGKNGIGEFSPERVPQYQEILNGIEMNEIKILESLVEVPQYTFLYLPDLIEEQLRKMTEQRYRNYLESIGKPFMEIDALIASMILDLEVYQKEKTVRFNKVYKEFKNGLAKSSWIIEKQTTNYVTFLNSLNYSGTTGIRLRIDRDVLYINGPDAVFSKYHTFQKEISNESREFYHQLFKNILIAFKSDFILYAHEWSGIVDDSVDDLSTTEILNEVNSRISEKSSLHNMSRFYFEQLAGRQF